MTMSVSEWEQYRCKCYLIQDEVVNICFHTVMYMDHYVEEELTYIGVTYMYIRLYMKEGMFEINSKVG